ncbi:MAG: B12-binding domain-containing radical SAM protein [Promethearchaeota archaeon]|jgi:radical SAM superfamily enzyme YgiQ (UPF0313 family)
MFTKPIEILMVFPSGGDVYYTHFKYHLGSAYIIAYLREHGFSAEQFISNETYNVRECVKKIMIYKPKIVGFTVYEKNYMQCVLISKGLKSFDPEITILFGGPTPTVQSKEILKSFESVDLCVRQEGEETVLELLSSLSEVNFKFNQLDLHNIKGITFRNESEVVANQDCNILFSNKSVKNYLDKYPSPYLSGVIPASKALPTGVITARGCNQNCIYCNCAVMSKRNIYTHSVERVIEELAYISRSKKFLAPVPIYDDGFTILPARARRICEAIIEKNIKIPLLCATRCDMITKDLLDIMKQAGFQAVGFSLESAIPRVLRAIGKVLPPNNVSLENFKKEKEFIKKFKDMTSYAKKIGIKNVFVSIMVGLPGESLQDAQKTIKLINRLDVDFYTHNILHIFKGTPIYKNKKKNGFTVKPISQNNQITLINDYPFDVYKLKLGKNCSKIMSSKSLDYDTLKILSFNLNRKIPKSYFDNVIIKSNVLKSSVVKWLQENLAINGAIIQIYSNEEEFLKHQEINKTQLYETLSPSLYYESYYWENSKNVNTLRPGRMALFGKKVGWTISLTNTYTGLEKYNKGHSNMPFLICQDQALNDTKVLYDLLVEVSRSKNPFNYLYKRNPLPQFQNICRWTTNNANCQKLETAIIENDDFIRICNHSDPIGKIGSSFSDLERNLYRLKKENEEARNCSNCKQEDSCIKCLFPHPLSSKEYCQYKNFNFTNEPARIINVLNLAKDLLFKPANLIDF